MNKKGSLLVLLIPLVMMAVLFGFFIMDWGGGLYWSQKIQTLSDVVLLSSLEMRSEGLVKMAGRWKDHGQYVIGKEGDRIKILRAHFDEVAFKSKKLKRALSGYKGRIQSVIKVVAEANGFKKEAVKFTYATANRMGIVPMPAPVINEFGETATIDDFWYQRQWSSEDRLGDPDEQWTVEVNVQYPHLKGGKWWLKRRSTGKLFWDVNKSHPQINSTGNGGFPRTWQEAWNGNQFDPHRYPFFQTSLVFDEEGAAEK